MRIRPTGTELLSAARAVLHEALLPHLPHDEQQIAASIGRAMAIAAAEMEFDRVARREHVEQLEAARAVVREKLLARLPEDRRYDARLVAKAIAVAAMEMLNGDIPERAELIRLTALLETAPPTVAGGQELRAHLVRFYARLCADIRNGCVEPHSPRYAATYAHLREVTRQALSESHPAYLQARAESARDREQAL